MFIAKTEAITTKPYSRPIDAVKAATKQDPNATRIVLMEDHDDLLIIHGATAQERIDQARMMLSKARRRG